jgi:hypothetical protein
VQETAEQVTSSHSASVLLAKHGEPRGRIWRSQCQRPMGTMRVVVPGVDPKDLLEVTAADDQQPVQALGSDRAHPPFRVGVRVGRLQRRHKHLHTFRSEHVIKPAAELRVPIANKEAQPASSFFHDQQQVAGLLDGPRAFGVGVTPAT